LLLPVPGVSGLLEGPDIGCTEGGAGDLCCAEGPIGVMGEPEVGYGCPIEAGLIAGAVPEPPTEPAIQSEMCTTSVHITTVH